MTTTEREARMSTATVQLYCVTKALLLIAEGGSGCWCGRRPAGQSSPNTGEEEEEEERHGQAAVNHHLPPTASDELLAAPPPTSP